MTAQLKTWSIRYKIAWKRWAKLGDIFLFYMRDHVCVSGKFSSFVELARNKCQARIRKLVVISHGQQ
jgi:hypothetical protein